MSIFNLCSTSFSGLGSGWDWDWDCERAGDWVYEREQERVLDEKGGESRDGMGWDLTGPDCNPFECIASVAYKF